jgi:hypothetical protein
MHSGNEIERFEPKTINTKELTCLARIYGRLSESISDRHFSFFRSLYSPKLLTDKEYSRFYKSFPKNLSER